MKKVLFVCVGNTCRSQMAEGFAKDIARKLNKDILVESAGTHPGDKVNPTAIEVMKEVGIDISAQKPKMLDLSRLKEFDMVIAMGCDVASYCPVLFDERVVDWGIKDPFGKPIEVYRRVRDMIREKVESLISSL